MPVCVACDQLLRQPSTVAPHSGLTPLAGHSGPPFMVNNDKAGSHERYLCRMCHAILTRSAMDDNSDPVWDLYAG
jgi:hypothetical protein